MKCSENWLREWVNPKLSRDELAHVLTMGGFEVEGVTPVASEFKDIFVGQITALKKIPETNLHLCTVDIGKGQTKQIVCGAPNVKVGLKVAVAPEKAILPNNQIIKKTTIQGVTSEGMLCSARELDLSDESDVIFELTSDALIGEALWTHLCLHDYVFDVSVMPNRGDCLSTRGIAREVHALTETPLNALQVPSIKDVIKDVLPVKIEAKSGCPHYVGRVIKNVKLTSETPTWLKERLRRAGMRSIHPIVDVTNYVLLELGQPMHAFDLNQLQNAIVVRESVAGEKILLLDGTEKELDNETLVIADYNKPLAIAGVMGGMDSGVTLQTKDIFLESAYFNPRTIARQRQYYGITSESSYRFERGVDPQLQKEAMERATQLILEIAGGDPGPIIEEKSTPDLPQTEVVTLSQTKVNDLLGLSIEAEIIESILTRLNFTLAKEKSANTWRVTVPAYRFDVSLPEDLIEEIARVHGYDKIPTHTLTANLQPQKIPDAHIDPETFKIALRDLGYHEVISYSFVDRKMQHQLNPEVPMIEVINPITSEMSVMRTNLWSGLLNTLNYNNSRQQNRVRIFELGTTFIPKGEGIEQALKLAGLISGTWIADQWGVPARSVDFFDLKGDIENLLALYSQPAEILFVPNKHAALHPGQTAFIYQGSKLLGMVGALHPTLAQALDITEKVFLFEINMEALRAPSTFLLKEVSKFPEIRRDIAILVKDRIPIQEIQATIATSAGNLLKNVFIFDLYQGKGIPEGFKSIAFGLVLQHPTRTLVENEVSDLIERVIIALKGQFEAELRS